MPTATFTNLNEAQATIDRPTYRVELGKAGPQGIQGPAGDLDATIFDAKGDLIGASAADTAVRVPAGSDGTVLTANSGSTSGVQWTETVNSSQQVRYVATYGNDTNTGLSIGAAKATVAAALADLPGGRGTIYFAGGTHDFTNLNLDGTDGVHFKGLSPANNDVTLRCTAADASDAISIKSVKNLVFENLGFSFMAGYTGDFLQTGHAPSLDSTYVDFVNCRFNSTETTARSWVNLNRAIIISFTNCQFFQGPTHHVIGMDGNYSNVVTFTNCTFRYSTSFAIANPGQDWVFVNCTFEPLGGANAGKAGAWWVETGKTTWQLTIIGCWLGDVSVAGNPWLLNEGIIYGLSIQGGFIYEAGTDQHLLHVGDVYGLAIVGVKPKTLGTASFINFSAQFCRGGAIIGCDFGTVDSVYTNSGNVLRLALLGNGSKADELIGSQTGFGSRISPSVTNTHDLGSSTFNWRFAYASGFFVGSSQVLKARRTGWSNPTGTGTKTAFDTTTVTTEQLAERVKALIDDFHSSTGHGLLGP